jgi:hypothetical protein
VERLILDGREGLLQILSGQGFEAFRFQPVAKKFAIWLIVLDHQNATLHDFSVSTGGTALCNCLIKASCQSSCL